MTFLQYLETSWGYIVFIVGALGIIGSLYKSIKSIKKEINKPFEELKSALNKIDLKVEKTAQDDALVKEALLTMQRQQILNECEKCIRKGKTTAERKQTIYSQFESYKSLGGNSFVQDFVKKVMDLEIEDTK